MTKALVQRMGGAERIAEIIEDALDRHAVNPVLAQRLRGKDLPTLKQLGVQLFCSGDLRTVHAGVSISEQELAAAIDDVVAAMLGHGVGPREVDEVAAMLYSLRNHGTQAIHFVG